MQGGMDMASPNRYVPHRDEEIGRGEEDEEIGSGGEDEGRESGVEEEGSNKSGGEDEGSGSGGEEEGSGSGGDEIRVSDDKFDIPFNAPAEGLRRRRRQAALGLNASRRFRYTLDLNREEEKEQTRRKIRAHAQVIRAAFLFKEAAESEAPVPAQPSGGYGIGVEQLTSMTRDHDSSALQQYGGVKGLASMLKTNLEKGIIEPDDAELLRRRNAFGANTYPQKKGRSFFVFLWEACQDLTLIILIVAAVISLVLGIKTESIKEGWYDGGSIAFAVILVIVVIATSNYKQSLQFQSLNEEKRNIRLEVLRGGRRVEISKFDVVVGDVVQLKIGDKVPANGILISGHFLAVDESSMTRENKIAHKDLKSPFMMSGCKVVDGYGIMLHNGCVDARNFISMILNPMSTRGDNHLTPDRRWMTEDFVVLPLGPKTSGSGESG